MCLTGPLIKIIAIIKYKKSIYLLSIYWGKYANIANMVLWNPVDMAREDSTMGWLGRVQHLFQPAVRIIRGYWFHVGTSNEFGTNRAAVPGPTATTCPAPIGVVTLGAQAGILGQPQLLLLCYEVTSTAELWSLHPRNDWFTACNVPWCLFVGAYFQLSIK